MTIDDRPCTSCRPWQNVKHSNENIEEYRLLVHVKLYNRNKIFDIKQIHVKTKIELFIVSNNANLHKEAL